MCNAHRVKQQNLPDCTLIAIQSNTNYGQGSGINSVGQISLFSTTKQLSVKYGSG